MDNVVIWVSYYHKLLEYLKNYDDDEIMIVMKDYKDMDTISPEQVYNFLKTDKNTVNVNGSKKEVDMFDSSVIIEGFDNTVLGKQTITLNYLEYQDTFEIDIIKPKNYILFIVLAIIFIIILIIVFIVKFKKSKKNNINNSNYYIDGNNIFFNN